jgi:uncharacterized protein YoxC
MATSLKKLFKEIDGAAEKITAKQQKEVRGEKEKFEKIGEKVNKITQKLQDVGRQLETLQKTYRIQGPTPLRLGKEDELPQQTPTTGAGRK